MSDATSRLVSAVSDFLVADRALHGIFSCFENPCRNPKHLIIVDSYQKVRAELYNAMEACSK